MDDDRTTIEVAQDISRNWSGESMTTSQMVDEFQLYGHAKRTDILDQIDCDYRKADTSNLRKFHEITSFRKSLQQVHHTLRKAGR